MSQENRHSHEFKKVKTGIADWSVLNTFVNFADEFSMEKST